MARICVLHICKKHLAKKLPVEDINTHGSEVALWMLRLLFKFNDMSCLICIHNTKTACFLHRNFDNGNRCICVVLFMIFEHLVVIHLIDVVSREDQQIVWGVCIYKVNILGNSVSCSSVYIKVRISFLTWWKYINSTVLRIKSPSSSCCCIAVQKYGFVLCQNTYNVNSAVCAVTKWEINNAVFSAI